MAAWELRTKVGRVHPVVSPAMLIMPHLMHCSNSIYTQPLSTRASSVGGISRASTFAVLSRPPHAYRRCSRQLGPFPCQCLRTR
jgi:hypothetical protein